MANKLKELLWPLGGFLLSLLVMPIAIEQYPEIFKESNWILPVSMGVVAICWIAPLILHDRARRIWQFGYDNFGPGPTVIGIVFALVLSGGALIKIYHFHVHHLESRLSENRKGGKASEQTARQKSDEQEGHERKEDSRAAVPNNSNRNSATPEKSKLEVTKTEKGPFMLNKLTGDKAYVINVYYADTGTLPITAMTRRLVVVFTPINIEPDREKDAEDKSLQVNDPGPDDQKNGMQPGREPPLHFFSFPSDDNDMASFLPYAQDVLDGKIRMYFYLTFKYYDESLPRNSVRITRYCGWFSGNFDVSHNCGINRIYTAPKLKFRRQ